MKKIVIALLILIAGMYIGKTLCSPYKDSNSYRLSSPEPQTVFVCIGGSAERYHRTENCSGLRNCRHQIREVNIDEAKDRFNRTACHICMP
ncbi:MAG: hypothetical protein ACRC3B_02345 [Bacteroidia bacterium]